MENVGAICDFMWSDEANFMEQVLGNWSLPAVSCFWPNMKNDEGHGVDEASMFSFSIGKTNNSNSLMAMEDMESGDDESQQKSFKEEDQILISTTPAYHEIISNKRPRIPAQLLSQRSKRSKKSCAKVDENENVVLHSTGCYSVSEDDSNEVNGMNSTSTSSKRSSSANPRATRGSATDPQSLYARKRRERINERLKVLQTLVPNGTKVDISTMLEEAVQYVNFLQLQIKLLSSDDLWMYSPIAYNGMDLGLDLKFPSLKPQS